MCLGKATASVDVGSGPVAAKEGTDASELIFWLKGPGSAWVPCQGNGRSGWSVSHYAITRGRPPPEQTNDGRYGTPHRFFVVLGYWSDRRRMSESCEPERSQGGGLGGRRTRASGALDKKCIVHFMKNRGLRKKGGTGESGTGRGQRRSPQSFAISSGGNTNEQE